MSNKCYFCLPAFNFKKIFYLTIRILIYFSTLNSTAFAALNDPSDVDLVRRLTAVGTGPYFGLGSTYDGSDLVVLQPNIHRDLALLKQNKYMANYTGERQGPRSPYVQLSGLAEVQLIAQSKAKNSVDLTASNLDIAAWVNNWLTAYANFGIEYDEMQKANFRMILAFITFGNLNVTPFYFSLGQMFIPFGSFSTGTSDMGNLPRSVGRLYEKALSAGYYHDSGLHVTAAVYNGTTKNSNTSNLDQWAGTISFKNKAQLYEYLVNYKFGISYTNNIAEAATLRQIFNAGAKLNNFVPAVDGFGSVTIGPYTARGEFITATEHFSSHDILQKGLRIQPKSFSTELEYATYLFGKAGWFTLHYSEVMEAAMASTIQHQIGINSTFNILKDTLFSIEYSHRKSYGSSNRISNIPKDLSAVSPAAPLSSKRRPLNT